ncbi:arfaptin-1 isoform X2 [Anguilla anguilla]|uniref:arfaptin-1 isoform X2 n=1 Tax=Anguilla anguilla TaxID=7936 RepID=UPI0015A92DB1|nr:arfaptin-1 isoform X2 [Anguilla anguilla]
MSEVSFEADADKTQADDPRTDNEETVNYNEEALTDNEETLTDNEDTQNINEEALSYNEDGQTGDSGAQMDAGDVEREYEDVQIHDEDDNEIHNEEARKHDGEDAVMGSVDTPKGEGHSQKDSEDAEPEGKAEMAEDSPRSAAAEIPVTSNGDAEEGLGDVFQSDPSLSGGMSLSDTHITSSNFGSTTEGIIEAGPYKGRPNTQAKGGALVLSDDLKNPAMEKLELVRKWSINTYKCTRQILSEKLGRGSRTVDLELEAQIEVLRDNKRKYEHVVKLAQTLASQLFQMIQTQRQLGDAFADLSLKSPELHEEFGFNADTQKLLSKNGETLLGAINFFIASVNTLVDKTIEDTMINIKQYETARIEYDAYRTDLEELNLGPRDATTVPKIEASQQLFQMHREKYEKMRNDVSVKLNFLEENKVKVLHNQLILFHNAIAAYYAGNQQQLEQTLKQFHIKLKMPGGDRPSWLEEQH